MTSFEYIIAKVCRYVPSCDKKAIDVLLAKKADLTEWATFLKESISKGVSSVALWDEIYMQIKKKDVDGEHACSIIYDLTPLITNNEVIRR